MSWAGRRAHPGGVDDETQPTPRSPYAVPYSSLVGGAQVHQEQLVTMQPVDEVPATVDSGDGDAD